MYTGIYLCIYSIEYILLLFTCAQPKLVYSLDILGNVDKLVNRLVFSTMYPP